MSMFNDSDGYAIKWVGFSKFFSLYFVSVVQFGCALINIQKWIERKSTA